MAARGDAGRHGRCRHRACSTTRSRLPAGGTTTLRALVNEETRTGKGVIKHYNLRRAITVEAGLDKTVTDTVEANRIIAAEWQKRANEFPNTDIDFSGELDDIQESLDAMAILFLVGVGLIYLILAAQFGSYFQPLLILVTVPLAFTGVVLGLLVAQIRFRCTPSTASSR
jgi:multidrug efflux pump subunit AcrB